MFLRTFCQALDFLTDFISEPCDVNALKHFDMTWAVESRQAVWIMNLQDVTEQLSAHQKWNVLQEGDITRHFLFTKPTVIAFNPVGLWPQGSGGSTHQCVKHISTLQCNHLSSPFCSHRLHGFIFNSQPTYFYRGATPAWCVCQCRLSFRLRSVILAPQSPLMPTTFLWENVVCL